MMRRHIKLYILLILEALMLLVMIKGSFDCPAEYHFGPEDFNDNVGERDYISVDDKAVKVEYDPDSVIYDDEGRVIGDDILTWKFPIGSGAYDFVVSYEADAGNGYAELYSDSWITDPIADKIPLGTGKNTASSKLYIPFGRSMHDVQINIHYYGPGTLRVYGIDLIEVISYRWVPIVGYFLLFALVDSVLFLVFARSGAGLRNYVREHWELPALLAVAFLASLPALNDFIYVGHDIRFHLARIIAISREISYGQFPVRMLTDMLKGYSYPTSTFYCDFFLYPVALLYMLGLPMRMCWQINVIVLNLATAWISYVAFKRISGNVKTGVTGSALYTLSAYRIVDIYLRTALGEFTALTFIPLVLLGIWIIYYEDKETKDGWLYLGAGMAAIAMCHLLSVEMISAFLMLFCLCEFKRTFTAYRMLCIVKAAVMTVLLSCWFIFPMLLYMREVSLSMYDHQKYIQMSGAYPSQIFNIFLQGTGFSSTGTYDEMPLSIGGGIVASLALLLYRILKKESADRRKQKTALFLTTVSLLIAMYFFPWDSIASITEGRLDAISRLVRMVQFPWRYLEITTAVLSISAVCGLKALLYCKERQSHEWEIWTAIILSGTVISLGSFYVNVVNGSKTTKAYGEEYIENGIAFEEYLPSGSGRVVDLPQDVEAAGGDSVSILSYDSLEGERRLELVNNGDEAPVLIPLFAYPGFHAEDSGSHEQINFDQGENARIRLQIPSGYRGTVRIYYREPWLWRLFEVISFAAFIGYAIVIADRLRQRK